MKVIVDSENTKQGLLAICSAAGKAGDLGIMKVAVIIAEAITVEKAKNDNTKETNMEVSASKK